MAYNTNSGGRVYRPYRKASEYLTNQQKSAPTPVTSTTPKSDLEKENEVLRQKVVLLTRNLDHAEAEYSQSREYLESQLDVTNDKLRKVSAQYKTLQSSYVTLQTTNRELESKVTKVINRLENEKSSMVQEINELTRKITDLRGSLLKAQEENERLRKDCNLAVQLLKCNQSSYQSQKPEQVPQELQQRVSDYKMQLQDYNEYINPYADSDSENEDRSSGPKKTSKEQRENSISTDVLAQVLQKPENVHMNLEAADFIRDPQLTSTYKARYTERKLIKPNYGEESRHQTVTKASSPWEHKAVSESNSGPWEQNHGTSNESSPWERRAIPATPEYQEVDEAPAGAYGAYAVGSRRRMPITEPDSRRQIPQKLPQQPVDQFSQPSPPSSPEDIEFKKPTIPDAYVAPNFLAKAAEIAASVSSSKSSSQKSSPFKVRGKESASRAETSSLLTGDNSDEDELYEAPTSQNQSPSKSYIVNDHQPESHGLLNQAIHDDEYDANEEQGKEITLEWDSMDGYEEEHLPIRSEDVVNTNPPHNVVPAQPQENLLLSYNEVEVKKEPEVQNIEDLLSLNIESPVKSPGSVTGDQHDNQPSGHLLSEIVNSNPSFESFLLTTPPPPHEFASVEEEKKAPDASIYTVVDQGQDLGEQSASVLPNLAAEDLVKPNDVIEVVDIDDEQPDVKRRNSFEQAREYGSVMD